MPFDLQEQLARLGGSTKKAVSSLEYIRCTCMHQVDTVHAIDYWLSAFHAPHGTIFDPKQRSKGMVNRPILRMRSKVQQVKTHIGFQ